MIRIDESYCKGCKICTEFCPKQVIRTSTVINKLGYYPPVVERGRDRDCNGCRLCELLCPEFAIFIVHE